MDLQQDFDEMEEIRLELAEYFCEERNTFKLEECIKIFNMFCQKFKKAIQVRTCLVSIVVIMLMYLAIYITLLLCCLVLNMLLNV